MGYSDVVAAARLQVVVDAIDGGVASGPGYIEICSAAYASILATIPLNSPCGTVSARVLTFDFPVEDTSADASGTAVIARIKDSDGTVIRDGLTVGTSGTNIVLVSTAITAGQPVQLATGTITHP